ncbi:hypothetical protein SAMN04515674_101230 [Pseudarcicella hirudinis]|uniref:Uncharacterized protein n=1 Tax=Pseudarcicella hirudinis TaxID=1079859 RepID=A0A1I5MBI3_9BACT|nr:hypothetical protein SAMN04515674_101230 [Pseudarcicella hirudinis]
MVWTPLVAFNFTPNQEFIIFFEYKFYKYVDYYDKPSKKTINILPLSFY